MTDPRAANSFILGPKPHELATFVYDATIVYSAAVADGSVSVGLAVSIESSNVVTLAGDGENVLGKLLHVEADGFCTVQHSGFMTLPGGSGASLTAGSKIVGALSPSSAEGYIKVASTEHTLSRGMIIDSSTATAVVVML